MAGYTRQETYVTGDTIQADDTNNEFDQLVSAFSATTGHAHDGTSAEGPVIGLIGDAGVVSPLNQVLIDTPNNYIEFWIDVASTSTQQMYIADGALLPTTTNDIDLGADANAFKTLYLTTSIVFEGSTADGFETTIAVADPTADRTWTIPDSASDTFAGLAATQTFTNKTLTSAVLNTGVSGTAVLDEDTMVSNSATQLATQQSIKAYVDTTVAAAVADPLTIGTLTVGSGSITDSGGSISFGNENLTTTGTLDAGQTTLSTSGAVSVIDITNTTGTESSTIKFVGSNTYNVGAGNALHSEAANYFIYDETGTTFIYVYDKATTTHELTGSATISTGATGTIATFSGATNDDLYITNRTAGIVGLQTNSADTLEFKSNTTTIVDQSNVNILSASTGTFAITATATTVSGTLAAGAPEFAGGVVGGATGFGMDITNTNDAINDLTHILFGVTAGGTGAYHKAGIFFEALDANRNGTMTFALTSAANATNVDANDSILQLVGSTGNGLFTNGLGVGGTLTDGTLHVIEGSAGVVAADTSADTAVFESSGAAGISILAAAGNNAQINFGEGTDNNVGILFWEGTGNNMQLQSSNVGSSIILAADAAVANLTLSGASGAEAALFAGTVAQTRSANGNLTNTITNSNVGTAARSSYNLSNGTYTSEFQMFGTGWTTSGLAMQDSLHIQTSGTNGINLNTNDAGAGSMYRFGINGSEKARLSTAGLETLSNFGVRDGTTYNNAMDCAIHVELSDTSGYQVMVEQASTGDAAVLYQLTGVQNWIHGVDNTDTDAFVISRSSALGTNNVLRLGTDDSATIAGTLSVTGALDAGDASAIGDGATGSSSWALWVRPSQNSENGIMVEAGANSSQAVIHARDHLSTDLFRVAGDGSFYHTGSASGDFGYILTTANSGTGLYFNSSTTNQIDLVGWDGSGANAINIRNGSQASGQGILLDTSGDVWIKENNFYLHSTTASSTTIGPALVLRRDGGASSNDHKGGVLYFNADDDQGTDTTFAYIYMQITDAGNGAGGDDDGALIFGLGSNGGVVDVMSINGLPGGSGFVWNETGLDLDFRVEGGTVSDLFFVDAGNDLVGIGSGSAGTDYLASGTYTPTWTSTGVAPAIGNGFIGGEWKRVGDMVTVTIRMELGSTSTTGTGDYRWSLPFTAYDHSVDLAGPGNQLVGWGNGRVSDAGTGYADVTVGAVYNTSTCLASAVSTAIGSPADVSATSPMTWAAGSPGDSISFTLTYRVA